jgi:mannose/fructose/N-acetylgalactosamine-specific phosphotransferase system component IID
MVVGAMTATMVSMTTPLQIGHGDGAVKIQEVLDGIMPGLLPLGLTLLVYYLLKKNVKVTHILVGLVVVGILGKVIGIL